MFEVGGAESFPEQSFGYCWVKGIRGEHNLSCTYTKTPLAFYFGAAIKVPDLVPDLYHVYLKAKWSSLRALGCPVLQLYFCIRPFAKLSPAVSLTKGSLNPPSWRTTSCITTQLTHLVSGALDGVVPICRLPVVTPQTSSNRTCHCCICGGQTSGCSSSLDELLPCDEECTVNDSDFPAASPVLLAWVVLGLCACLLTGRCSLW